MKRSSRSFVTILVSVSMAFGITACNAGNGGGSQASKSGNSDVKGKLVMVTNATQYDTVVQKFKKDYPNVDLVWDQQSGTNYATVCKTRLLAGAEGIDVFTPSRADYPELAKNKQLLDLTGSDYLNNFTDGVIDSATVNHKVYGLPMTAQTYVIWYNKTVFDKYNLKAPTTMDEMKTVCAKLKSNGVTPFVTFGKSDQLHVFIGLFYNNILSTDPSWLDELASGKAKWTDAASIKAITEFQDVVKNGYILDGSLSMDDTEAYQAFYQGKAAMMPNGAWSIDKVSQARPTFDLGAFSYVSDTGVTNKTQYVNGTIMAGAAGSKNIKAIKAFLSWIAKPENAQFWCNEAKQFGTIKGITSDFDPAAKLVSSIYEKPKSEMFHAYLSPNAKKIVYVEFQKLMAQKETNITPETVAKEIQAEQDKDVSNAS